MKKLKNIDFKALFINHGEKFGMGLIVLFVLLALSSTSWSRYAKTPDELKTKVAEAKNRITSPQNVWPQAKSEQFVVVDFNGKAREVFTSLNTEKYEFSSPLFWPLYRKKEKARQPDLSAPQLLMAEAGNGVLLIRPQQEAGLMNGAADPNQPPETPTDSTIRPVEGSNVRPPGGAAGAPGPAGGHAGGPAAPFGIAPATPPRASGPAGGHGAAPPMMAGGPGMMEMYGSGGGGTGGGTAKGVRFVVARAVVPIREQIERASKALNMNYQDASAVIEYTDFFLQRQTAVAGPEPWSGPWEDVDPQRSLEVIQESDWDDADPVPSELQDAVITSPLPRRLLRYWGDTATHPSIKHFQPTEADRQREMKLVAQLMEQVDKMNLDAQQGARGGFSRTVNDVRGLTKKVLNSGRDGADVMQNMARQMNEGQNGPRMAVADVEKRLTASGRLYLFRYIDFDVQPGMAYRYRVRLQLRNPNYKRPYEEVENPDFTKDEFVMTDWSNISNPAVVPDTVHYFLKDVERDPVREEKHGKRAVASIAMFEWDAKLGTMLADTLKILSVGQFISEKKKSLVLDPATPSFEEKDVPFVTEDVLVDAVGDMELSPELHPDLQLKPDRGRKDAKIGVLPEALVATALGELKDLNPVSKSAEEQALKKTVDEERKGYEYLRNAPTTTASPLDGGGFPGAGPAGMMTPPQPMTTGRSADPRRKQKGGAGGPAGAHGGGPAAGPAGGPAGAHGGGPAGGAAGGRSTRPRP